MLHGVDLEVRRGDRLAIMGPNGIGKSTLLKIVMDDLEADEGEVKWGYETHRGYFAQDHKEDFDDSSRTAEEWLWDFCASRDRGYVRGQMGMMLFSGDDGEKRLEALSGGEAARLIFSRLAIERPNVLILDEPTNHLDLESIEALVHGLKNFDGTLILVSHDRWFVSQLATRVVEIKPDEVKDYLGTYEEYVHFCGDDHLDSDSVVMKAKAERKDSKKSGKDSWKENKKARSVAPEVLLNRLTRQRDELTRKIETAEARISEIDQAFCEPGFFEDTSADEVADLDNERAKLKGKVEDVMSQWEGVEREIERVPNS